VPVLIVSTKTDKTGEGEQSNATEFKSKMTPLLDKYKFVQASFVCSAKHQEGVQAVFQFAAMMVSAGYITVPFFGLECMCQLMYRCSAITFDLLAL
jgi:predicted GTPase